MIKNIWIQFLRALANWSPQLYLHPFRSLFELQLILCKVLHLKLKKSINYSSKIPNRKKWHSEWRWPKAQLLDTWIGFPDFICSLAERVRNTLTSSVQRNFSFCFREECRGFNSFNKGTAKDNNINTSFPQPLLLFTKFPILQYVRNLNLQLNTPSNNGQKIITMHCGV